MGSDSELTIVIPCYNEEASLPEFLNELENYAMRQNMRVIITNDGSTDSTQRILNQYNGNFRIINHKVNSGYGAALKSAIAAADTEYVVSIDADGQHYLEDIDVIFQRLKAVDADMVVGCRSRSGGVYRSTGKWLIRIISRMLVKTNVKDINSGMKLYRTSLAKKYLRLCPDTMAFSDIITLIFCEQKHLVVEENIRIKERTRGKSTIGISTAFGTVLEMLNIVMLFNPIRIFLPIAVIFIILGIGWGLPIIIAGRGVSVGAALLILMGVITFLLGLIAEQLSLIRKRF